MAKRATRTEQFLHTAVNLAAFPLQGLQAHGSLHQGFWGREEMRGSTRFEQGLFGGIPAFVEEEEMGVHWPGSFRRKVIAGFELGGGSELSHGGKEEGEIDEPDLTLRL